MYSLIFKLAFKSAFLRLSRTLLVVIMIAVSMGMMLSIQGLYDGMTHSMIEKTKRSDCGEISIYAKGYRLSKALDKSIVNSSSIVSELEKRADISAVVSRLKVEGLVATARKSSFSTLIGIDVDAEEKFGRFSEFLKSGQVILGKRDALIGRELAKTLKVKIGSKIIFSTQDNSGEINAMVLKVKGILQTNTIALDASAIYINKIKLQTFLGVNQDVASQIGIRTESQVVITTLQTKYKHLDVKSFLELYPMIKQMKDMMVIFNSITFVIVMLVVFIGIMGVMYVSILDRIREFGIMKSIGMSYRLIQLQIILEALFVGLSGYVLGAVLGYGILSYLSYVGLNLSAFSEGMSHFGMDTVIYAQIKLSYFSSTFIAIIMASLVSVLLPLRKIKTMNSIEVTKVET
jgi:putative ABC transport system permease protein